MAFLCRRLVSSTPRSCQVPRSVRNFVWSRACSSNSSSPVEVGGSSTTSTPTAAQSHPISLVSGKDFLIDFRERGLSSNESAEAQQLFLSGEPIVVYAGFDPTAASLHVGHILMLTTLLRFHEAGHTVIALVGGGTAIVGDPSDQVADRKPMKRKEIESNTKSITEWIRHFFDRNRRTKAEIIIVNNLDWYKDMNVLDFFTDYATEMRTSTMLGREFVQSRLQGSGLNLKEFSYQAFQAVDFLHLHKTYGCNLQVGGRDQWPNILGGMELIKKCTGNSVHGVTVPLLTNKAGTKLSKSQGNSLWLHGNKTSPFKLYQYFLNMEDAIMDQYVNTLSFLPVKEIRRVSRENRTNSVAWLRQKMLGKEIITRVHGEQDFDVALAVTHVLYGRSWTAEEAAALTDDMLELLHQELPSSKYPMSYRHNADIVKLMVEIELIKEGRRAAAAGSKLAAMMFREGKISCNGYVVSEVTDLDETSLLCGKYSLFRCGKKAMHLIRWVDS